MFPCASAQPIPIRPSKSPPLPPKESTTRAVPVLLQSQSQGQRWPKFRRKSAVTCPAACPPVSHVWRHDVEPHPCRGKSRHRPRNTRVRHRPARIRAEPARALQLVARSAVFPSSLGCQSPATTPQITDQTGSTLTRTRRSCDELGLLVFAFRTGVMSPRSCSTPDPMRSLSKNIQS